MARISTYAIDGIPTVNDKVIGTNVDDADITMNYTIGDIIALVPGGYSVSTGRFIFRSVIKWINRSA